MTNIANKFPSKQHPIGCVLAFFGDPPPMSTQESMDSILQAQIKNLPALTQVTAQNILPMEQAVADAYKAINPQYAQTNLDIYKQYAPQANAIGAEMAKQNALSQAATEAEVLKGAGRDVTLAALENAKLADPEYYKTRELGAAKLAELLNSYDANKLSGSAAAETERQLNRMSGNMGTGATPSGTQAAVNALGFGSALNQQKAGLANALAQVPQNLAAFKSGVDVMQQGVGRGSQAQYGGQNVPTATAQNVGNATNTLSNNMFSAGAGLQKQAAGLDFTRKSAVEKVNEGIQGFMQTAGSICCFVSLFAFYQLTLPEFIRERRDAYMPEGSSARTGYRVMSSVVVPYMKYDAVRNAVDKLMVAPLTRNAAYEVGLKEYSRKDHLAFKVWYNVWNVIGKVVS